MPYTNPKELLIAITALPAAIEAKLPTGAPKVSVTLTDIANKMPVLPNFPMALPDLPAVPTLPEMPTGAGLRRRTYVTGVTVIPVTPAPTSTREVIPSPAAGVLPEVYQRRGF